MAESIAENLDLIAITALLPLTASLLVSQVNPYHALVIRGILGAVAALVYALFGAADVALTEALVGTMLSITLYAVAVRSSLSMRVGLLEADAETALPASSPLNKALRQLLDAYHMRLECISYPSPQALQTALDDKDIHALCVTVKSIAQSTSQDPNHEPSVLISTRVSRLYDLMRTELPPEVADVTFYSGAASGVATVLQPQAESTPGEVPS